ncbi:hypothetical protein H2200_002455 [Cladophialophora chaetospira]|uniref:Uncharacterized protein n=1 Tax=Cladophialophora chaetospira TaxID=386627 RepID=A0AA39CN28_9EURO|nr:hypothetical protein H2200_002455 [Cladophialophora chaetospira]
MSSLSLNSPPAMGSLSMSANSPLNLKPDPALDEDAVSITNLISISYEPVTFDTLPTETRLNIYHHLIREIKLTVRQKGKGPAQSGDPSINNIRDHYSVEPISLLLVSKKIHAEVKPIVDAAPLVIAGLGVESFVRPSHFPVGILSRVLEMIIFGTRFACLRSGNLTTGLQWSRDLHTPRLRTVRIESPLKQTRFFPDFSIPESHDVEFPIKILHLIAQWLYDERAHHQSTLGVDKEELMWYKWGQLMQYEQYQSAHIKTTKDVITRNNITLKSRYRCEISAKDPASIVYDTVVMETFDTTLALDRNGWRIEELPDLRGRW